MSSLTTPTSGSSPLLLNLPVAEDKKGRRDDVNAAEKRLDFLVLPGKGVSALIGLNGFLPSNLGLLGNLSEQRATIKAVSSTFAVPKLITKQIKLLQAFQEARNNYAQGRGFRQLALDTKKIFLFFLKWIVAAIKIPLLLIKTRILDLTKISGHLPEVLDKTATCLSLGVACATLVENSTSLGSQIQAQLKGNGTDLKTLVQNPKIVKSGIKVFASAVKTAMAFAAFATMMLGWYLSPLFLVAASTFSFVTALISKLALNGGLLWNDRASYSLDLRSRLPT